MNCVVKFMFISFRRVCGDLVLTHLGWTLHDLTIFQTMARALDDWA